MRGHCLVWIALLLFPLAAKSGTGVCLTTLPPSPQFVPPAPYDSVRQADGMFWYGTAELWTDLGIEGVWHLTNNSDIGGGYVTKLIFWTKGFDWRKEAQPELIVTARRTDGDSPSVAVAHANAVFVTGKTPALMTGIRIPAAGCWEVTAYYRSRTLSFTVSVQP